MLDAAPSDETLRDETLLEVNNIEVIYNHVILWVAMARARPRRSRRCRTF
jgi:hypothetical protein